MIPFLFRKFTTKLVINPDTFVATLMTFIINTQAWKKFKKHFWNSLKPKIMFSIMTWTSSDTLTYFMII